MRTSGGPQRRRRLASWLSASPGGSSARRAQSGYRRSRADLPRDACEALAERCLSPTLGLGSGGLNAGPIDVAALRRERYPLAGDLLSTWLETIYPAPIVLRRGRVRRDLLARARERGRVRVDVARGPRRSDACDLLLS